MTADTLFQFFNSVVLLPWLLMLLVPRFWLTQYFANTQVFVSFLALAYTVLLGYFLFFSPAEQQPALDFMSLDGVAAMFANKEAVLVGWIHYLAFDLLAGIWVFRDAQKFRVPRLLYSFPLLFTFLFGPFGFGLYQLLRLPYRR